VTLHEAACCAWCAGTGATGARKKAQKKASPLGLARWSGCFIQRDSKRKRCPVSKKVVIKRPYMNVIHNQQVYDDVTITCFNNFGFGFNLVMHFIFPISLCGGQPQRAGQMVLLLAK
jgi:hypothetical protein